MRLDPRGGGALPPLQVLLSFYVNMSPGDKYARTEPANADSFSTIFQAMQM
jgi:hypothetical protein